MMPAWTDWKPFPRNSRGELIEAPIGPGVFEVRHASSGALYAFAAVDNVALALAALPSSSRSLTSRVLRRQWSLPELVYRTCATSSLSDARTIADRMLGRRDAYMAGAA